MGALVITALFALALVNRPLQVFLQSRVLLFFGLVSYPLYLIHGNAMVSMIIQMHTYLPNLPGFLYPVLPLALLSTIAYLISRYGEPFVKKILIRGTGLTSDHKMTRNA